MAWKTGDQVVLKSGGPNMTVDITEANDQFVNCKWFSGKKLESGRFKADALKAAPTDDED